MNPRSASARTPQDPSGPQILAEGKYLRLINDADWEYAERARATGVVAIVAAVAGRLLLTEQFRKAVNRPVIDLPAGLAGDVAGAETEELATAARRELLEEIGYAARRMVRLADCPTSPGLTNEIVTFFKAVGLKRISEGGGDDSEHIEVHAVPLSSAARWLKRRVAAGCLIDAKVYAGLFFAGR